MSRYKGGFITQSYELFFILCRHKQQLPPGPFTRPPGWVRRDQGPPIPSPSVQGRRGKQAAAGAGRRGTHFKKGWWLPTPLPSTSNLSGGASSFPPTPVELRRLFYGFGAFPSGEWPAHLSLGAGRPKFQAQNVGEGPEPWPAGRLRVHQQTSSRRPSAEGLPRRRALPRNLFINI